MQPSASNRPIVRDAVLLVPGIGGSELSDPVTKKPIWGLGVTELVKGLLSGGVIEQLNLDNNLEPSGLLRSRSFVPGFGRLDPYSELEARIRAHCLADEAFVTFPYDWRQRVVENAARFSQTAYEHLARWRKTEPDAQLAVVGHSMGGLVAIEGLRQLLAQSALTSEDVSVVATLGTPFGGAVRAVEAINAGQVAPFGLHSTKVAKLCSRLPSVYDLLPTYPAFVENPSKPTGTRRATASDLVSIGADRELLAESTFQSPGGVAPELASKVVSLMGVEQPTVQSFFIDNGTAIAVQHIGGTDWAGDGTVYSGAAYQKDAAEQAHPLPQQHGSLAKSPEATAWVVATLQHRTLGPPQGGVGVGIDAPMYATTSEPITLRITSSEPVHDRPRVRVACTPQAQFQQPRFVRADARQFTAQFEPPDQGLYSIRVSANGWSQVTADMLVLDPKGVA